MCAPAFQDAQQQLSVQLQLQLQLLLQQQPQLPLEPPQLPPQEFPPPQELPQEFPQQQNSTIRMMIHRQELLFPLLKHILDTSLKDFGIFYALGFRLEPGH